MDSNCGPADEPCIEFLVLDNRPGPAPLSQGFSAVEATTPVSEASLAAGQSFTWKPS